MNWCREQSVTKAVLVVAVARIGGAGMILHGTKSEGQLVSVLIRSEILCLAGARG